MPADAPILILGDFAQPQFAPALAWLEGRRGLVRYDSLTQARHTLEAGPCDGQIFAAARPGCFTSDEVEELHRLAPMAPVIALVGTWCDGETRTGKPWPGVPRVAWHAWRSPFEMLWGAKPQKRSLWLPRIANDLERLVAQPALASCEGQLRLAIQSNDHLLEQALQDAAEAHGWRAKQLSQTESAETPHICIWDWSPWNRDEAAQFAQAKQQHPNSRFVILRDFVRPEFAEIASTDAVLAKPFSLADLLAILADTPGARLPAPA